MKLSHLLPVAAACAVVDGCGPAMDSKVVRADEPESQRRGKAAVEVEPEPQRRGGGRGIEEVERDVLEMCRLTYEGAAILSEQMAMQAALAACLVSDEVCSSDLSGRLPVAEIAECWEGADSASDDGSDSCGGGNPKVLADCVNHKVGTAGSAAGSSGARVLAESGEGFATLPDCDTTLEKGRKVLDALSKIVSCLRSAAEDDLMSLPLPDDIPDEIIP